MAKENEFLAERLATLREKKGISQYALAKLTGLSKQAVSQLELGRSEPTWTTIQLLAAALDVNCTAFTDPGVQLPENEPARPRGRPRKAAESGAAKAGKVSKKSKNH